VSRTFDTLVIGAGFGGLGTALALAESGADVCLVESLRYPGGCASTFSRKLPGPDGTPVIHRFESGATIASGLGEGQLIGRWLARHAPELEIEWADPMVELRGPDLKLTVHRDRQALVRQLSSLPGAPAAGIAAFFAEQERVANVLWSLFDDPSQLPPFDAASLARHATNTFRYAPLLGLIGRPVEAVMKRCGVERFAPLRLFVDALCQITVQCPAAEAEAPFAFAAMDYYHRGTGHVRGGFGALAWALASACGRLGADVRMASRVKGLRRIAGGWEAELSRGETVRARHVAANVLPASLRALGGGSIRLPSMVRALDAAVEDAWSAAMLYAVAEPPPGTPEHAHHLELVGRSDRALSEGNHVFVSISSAAETDRAPAGRRTMTMSTHVPLAAMRRPEAEQARYIAGVQEAMRATLRARAPEWAASIRGELTASPRTFERFTGRPLGAVGGIPRRAGLGNYRTLGPTEVEDGLYLVGDSVFPGQSALATAIGGVRTAAAIGRRLGALRPAGRSRSA
jgi:phytoene dehydrogenase-like protein